MFEKLYHICVFIGLCMLLPFVYFITEGEATSPTDVIVSEGVSLDEEIVEMDRDNNYIIFALEEEPLVNPLDKVKPDVEIEEARETETKLKVKPEPATEAKPEQMPEQKLDIEPLVKPVLISEPPDLPQSDPNATEIISDQKPSATGVEIALSAKEQQMFLFTNETRKNAGLPALQLDSRLVEAARVKSKDNSSLTGLNHASPTYGSLVGLLTTFGIKYRSASENLAMNSSGNVYDACNMMMNSSNHRLNILNPVYNLVGVGIYVRSDGNHYYTQLFVEY